MERSLVTLVRAPDPDSPVPEGSGLLCSEAQIRRLRRGLLLFALIFQIGCSPPDAEARKAFVGVWKSSRLSLPLHLYDNGEWEILDDDGSVLQYGIWDYRQNALLWHYKSSGQVLHESNAVLSAKPRTFQLREKNGNKTTFVRLE